MGLVMMTDYSSLKHTAQSLQIMCLSIIKDIEHGHFNTYMASDYLNDMELGDYSLYSALSQSMDLNEKEGE
jgi:hypothetical protein